MAKKQRTRGQKITRRAFMITGGLLGGGLAVGAGGLVFMHKKINQYSGTGFDGTMINAWVCIRPDNTIEVAVPRSEMGQGVTTSMPMLIAEELEVDISRIKVVQPQPEGPYANTSFVGNTRTDMGFGSTFDIGSEKKLMTKVAGLLPLVATGGSTSIYDSYMVFRSAGAAAKTMLIQAAAKQWNVDASGLYAEDGHIINKSSGKKLTYGELANAAAEIKLKKAPILKDRKDFKLIGTSIQRRDIPSKVNGTAQYGIDMRLEGMLYGAMRHATYHDGEILSITNQADIEAKPGVKKVILLPKGIGAVVVADNTWRAMNAAKGLRFEETGNNTLSSAEIAEQAAKILDNDEMIASPLNVGDAKTALDGNDKIIEARYEVPYLAHACMEPMNCTVFVDGDKAEVWVGSQGSSIVLDATSAATGISKKNIKVNITYLGGGFGRRAEIDFVTNAGHVAKEMAGTPIQLVYSREEDMRHEMYRPYALANFRALVKDNGEIDAWENKLAIQSVGNSATTRIKPAFAPAPKDDASTQEGAANIPYEMNNALFSFGQIEAPVQVGNWRSVGNSYNGYFVESFMDECAHAISADPYQFRKSKLKNHPRYEAVLDKVAEISKWNEPLPEGTFRGISLVMSFKSIVAEVAEITKIGEKEFKLNNFYCVIDCGNIVHPKTIESQLESGMIYGLTAAMYGEITFKDGEVEQYNFPQYEMMRLKTTPNFVVHIMDVDEFPGGVGEPSTPPAASALTNAIFAATGERVRSLPLSKHGYKFV